ncbi:MAG: serine/threonine protein kinase, partial [Bacteroidetes bacterium]|nr:serine/threonine protein kinase [Bacteroidota bacterium]
MEPKKLGRYEVTEQLGQGAMGIVYRGVDPAIGRTVALKTLKTTGEIPEQQLVEFKRRFTQEAQSAGRLQHPNIVTIFDVGEEQGLAYIAMELIQGKGLDEYVAAKHPFSIDQIVDIMVQICDGLGYAHRNGVIHRDIKPANIILTDDSKAKITDFGIAKITSTSATQTGMVVGTPSYMSPEQITGRGVDNRSDIFSIGAVFYELLTHERAFPGDNITTVMYRVVHENPAPIATVNMAVPAQFQNILSKAMAKNPDDRYPDAESMGKDIKNYRDSASSEMGATMVFKPGEPQGTVMMSSYNPPGTQSTTVNPAEKKTSGNALRKLPVLAAAGVVVLLLSWLLIRPSGPPTGDSMSGNASLEVIANILSGHVLLDSIPFELKHGKVTIDKIDAAEHELVIKHDRYQDYRTKLVFSEKEAKNIEVQMKLAPMTMPAGVDTAYLTVRSTPDVVAVMTNTGQFVGYTPVARLPFPAGKHTLVFSRDMYTTRKVDVDLRKGREQTITPNLPVKQGSFSVAGVLPPNVTVTLDGKSVKPGKDGTTYVSSVGQHTITLHAEGFAPLEKPITVSDTAVLELNLQLQQLFGSLSVSSTPSEADVFIDGEARGRTPLKLDSVAAGTHEVKV